MRLTNSIRDAFVRSAMNDLPKKDYTEEAKAILIKDAEDAMPPAVRELYKAHATHPYITSHYMNHGNRWNMHNLYHVVSSLQLPGPPTYKPSLAAQDKLEKLIHANAEQNRKHNELRLKLRAVAYAATTRKALAEALPEFEKYLPSELPGTDRSVPAVRGVVEDFVNAGWPKKKIAT